MRGISKRYGAVLANDSVDLRVDHGEVLGLLGENGAGKSTLMKVLYGLVRPDSGEILVNGRLSTIDGPASAIAAGIGIVTQHFSLAAPLSVVDNILLTERSGQLLNRKAAAANLLELAEGLGFDIDVMAPVSDLSVGERQRVEILKALYHQCQVLVLDEPTAVLRPQEIDSLFEIVERLKGDNTAIVLISHKLAEVRAACDRVVVLRAGRSIADVPVASATDAELAELMVGSVVPQPAERGSQSDGDVVLNITELTLNGPSGEPLLDSVNIDVRAGEILGIAGVAGNGQSELMAALHGVGPTVKGSITVNGIDVTNTNPEKVRAAGVGRLPEDRHGAMVQDLSVELNLELERLDLYSTKSGFDRAALRRRAEELIDKFEIKAAPEDPVSSLSGGNMQKVLLARVLSESPDVIAVSQPTRGLDIGATRYVRTALVEQRDRGAAILVDTQDLTEILEVSDRVAVMSRGRVVGVVEASETDAVALGLMMAGRHA